MLETRLFQGGLELFAFGFRFGAEANGDFDGLVRVRSVDQVGTADGFTLTACNDAEVF